MSETELQRIRDAYERRKSLPADLYAPDQPVNHFFRVGTEHALVELLHDHGRTPLAGKSLLDVGCGRGNWLLAFETLGISRLRLAGIELDEERFAAAQARLPGADLRRGDASRLPWADASFDLVSQFVVFSSILDRDLRTKLAQEMWRVCKPGGAVLWYDFFVDNPRNPDVMGIREGEIRRLFPRGRLHLRRTTLAPPLARRIVPRSRLLASLLEGTRLLNTHYAALIER